jgi:hypothetical protein
MKLDNYDKAMKGIEGLKQKALVMDSRVLRLHIKDVEAAIKEDGIEGYKPLSKPLSKKVLKAMAEKTGGFVEGVVKVDLSEIGNLDDDDQLEGFLYSIGNKLVGEAGDLVNVDYDVVGFEKGNVLHMKVTGTLEM